MNLLINLCVFTLFSTVSSIPGLVQFVPNNNPVLFYTQPATRSIVTPLQYQVSSFVPLPSIRVVQQPQATVLRSVQNLPSSNGIVTTRFIPISRPVLRNEEQNDAVVIDGVGNNIQPFPVQDNGGHQSQSYGAPNRIQPQVIRSQYGAPIPTPVFRNVVSQSYGAPNRAQPQQAIRSSYGAPVPTPVIRNVVSQSYGAPNRIIPQQVIRTSYGAPVPTPVFRNVNTITRQQPQIAQYEIQPARFVGELRSASQGPIFPVTVIARNAAQRNRNQNNGYQLSRQNTSREPGRSASRQQLRSQGGYGVSPIPVRNVVNGINRVQYYTVRYN